MENTDTASRLSAGSDPHVFLALRTEAESNWRNDLRAKRRILGSGGIASISSLEECMVVAAPRIGKKKHLSTCSNGSPIGILQDLSIPFIEDFIQCRLFEESHTFRCNAGDTKIGHGCITIETVWLGWGRTSNIELWGTP
jgi:hypothetical protein